MKNEDDEKDDEKNGEIPEDAEEEEEDFDWEMFAREMKRERFRRQCRRWIIGLLIYAGCLALFYSQVRFIISETPSIPYKICMQIFNLAPRRGDICVFEKNGFTMLKYLRATAGDRITNFSDDIYINGEFVCQAKRRDDLTPVEDFTVPEGCVFVLGTHEDSLDCRYREFGLVRTSELRGRALGLRKW